MKPAVYGKYHGNGIYELMDEDYNTLFVGTRGKVDEYLLKEAKSQLKDAIDAVNKSRS